MQPHLIFVLIISLWVCGLNHPFNEVAAVNISYDHRGLLFDGQPKLLISGSIHYPRSTPEMWPDLIAKAKDGGLDVIQTYVFWNAHEPQQGTYNFEDNLDLVKFVNLVNEAGLFVNLRIGPFIEAEWNFGGLPVWLYLQPGVIMRTYNNIFMNAMQNFTTKIVQLMKDENLFAWQGGPIIMAQIENEFGAYEKSTLAYAYAMWAAKMAVGLDIGVPWIMCKQPDAPDPVINTYNGAANGDAFEPNAPYKPKMWTEAYTGWFQTYGKPKPQRSEKNIAFEIARFFQSNGIFLNYYMYHGGTNFGRFGGGPFMTTSYDYDAPLDEYGLLSQPKWGHLKELHQVLKLCEPALITGFVPSQITLGPQQEAFIFSNGTEICAAFLSNLNTKSNATVQFDGRLYDLPAESVSILPDCKTVAFNTDKVRTQTKTMYMLPANFTSLEATINTQGSRDVSKQSWEWYYEPLGAWGETNVTSECCLEQIRTTKDTTDYLWYLTSVEMPKGGVSLLDGETILEIPSLGHVAHIFVNRQYTVSVAGNRDNPLVNVQQPIRLQTGTNEIAILSMTVGLQSGVRAGHIQNAGIQGPIMLNGLNGGAMNLSSQSWTHQVGLEGEFLELYSENGIQSVNWTSASLPPQNQSLIWYKTTFDAPMGDFPVALDLITMGKGQAWVNGKSIGRYWPSSVISAKGCSFKCNANQRRCYKGCRKSSQRWYHVPLSWLKPTGNLLILFEEVGGNPTGISLVARSTGTVCSSISEDYPAPLDLMQASSTAPPALPEVRLECDAGQEISSITFASFGTPRGSCERFQRGPCHARNSKKVAKQACLGKSSCAMQVTSKTFGTDPCPTQIKALSVVATCSPTSSSTE